MSGHGGPGVIPWQARLERWLHDHADTSGTAMQQCELKFWSLDLASVKKEHRV